MAWGSFRTQGHGGGWHTREYRKDGTNLARRREDAQHESAPPEDLMEPTRGRRKNKRRWCKGKVGTPHGPMVRMHYTAYGLLSALKYDECQKCKKRFYVWEKMPW